MAQPEEFEQKFEDENFRKELAREIGKFQAQPFTLSIMGQTGVGKTSLLKALFNKAHFNGNVDRSFLVDHVSPATREPQSYTITGENGQLLQINDLPGIGESDSADQNHLSTYEQYLEPSNLVIWAFQADNRSTTFDLQSLSHLFEKLSPQAREHLMDKLVFVLTKADTLLPSPWVMTFNNSSSVSFAPGEETRELIREKQEFFWERLISPFGEYVVSHTRNQEKYQLGPPFEMSDGNITYRGLLKEKDVKDLTAIHPEWSAVLWRLYNDQRPVACSAHFKFHLPQLMLVILNKLGSQAVQNFKRGVDLDRINYMSLDEARLRCNLQIWNSSDSRMIFDLENGHFPDPKCDSVFYKKRLDQPRRGLFSLFKQREPGQQSY